MYKSKRTQSGGSTASLGLSFLSKVSKILLSYYKGSLHQMLSKPELLLSKGYQYNILRQRTKQYTIYKEWTYFNPNEYIKRYYVLTDTKQKTIVLTEYYKFHRDIPRHFILPITSSLSKYHDKRRRIEYIRISRMLIGHLEQPTTTQYSILTSLKNLLGYLNLLNMNSLTHQLRQRKIQKKPQIHRKSTKWSLIFLNIIFFYNLRTLNIKINQNQIINLILTPDENSKKT